MSIGITTRFDAQLAINGLKAFEDAINEKEIYEVVGQRILKWIDDNFKKEGIELPWKPLKPATIARRRAGSITRAQGATASGRVGMRGISFSGAKPLQDTGRLKQSFIADAFYDRLIFGSQLKYAGTHQFGFGFVPARPMLPSDRMVELMAVDTIDKIISRAVAEANKGTA